MEYAKFAVDTKPYCVWDWDLRAIEHDFVERLDPAYFTYLAATYAGSAEGAETVREGEVDDQKPDANKDDPHDHHAALALRAAYIHAAETFFALLFASLQAPDCTIGWMHLYAPGDLRTLIRKVEERRPILSTHRRPLSTWQDLADLVLVYLVLDDKEKESRIKENFGKLWGRVAAEYAEETTVDEYNSIKHGLRVHSGGFGLALGVEGQPGVPAPAESMRSFGHSKYGSSHFRLRKIDNLRFHRGIESQARNWRIEESYIGLILLAYSIENLKSFLRIYVHGEEAAAVQFSWPRDEFVFQSMWESSGAPRSFRSRSIVEAEHIQAFSRQEILGVYGAPEPDADAHFRSVD